MDWGLGTLPVQPFWPRQCRHVVELLQTQLNGTNSPSKPIKVTILATDFITIEAFLIGELAKQLATRKGAQVSVLVPECVFISKWDKREFEEGGVTIVKAKKQPGLSNPLEWLYFPPADLETDTVIANGEQLGKIAQFWKKRYYCKTIYIRSTYEYYRYILEYFPESFEDMLNKLSRAADIPVAIGPKTTDDLTASLRSEKKEVFNFTPGIISKFSNLTHGTNDGKNFRVLLFGGNNPENFQEEGLELTAKIKAELKDKSYHLICIGAEKETKQQFANLFQKCGVPKRQLEIRRLPQTEKEWKDLLCKVDVAIMPSGEKEFGLEALFALSAGLPVLVHGESGFGEALRDVTFGTSAIVDSDDAADWALRIKKVRETDRKTRLEEAASLRSDYNEKYSWEKQCGDLVAKMSMMVSENVSSLPSKQTGVKGVKRRRISC